VARLKSQLARKLEKALTREFPPPATVKLDEHDGIIGVVTSDEFAGIESIDRQHRIGQIVEDSLSPDERVQVQVIVAVTPDEEVGYTSGD
jgi:hypothetical protein